MAGGNQVRARSDDGFAAATLGATMLGRSIPEQAVAEVEFDKSQIDAKWQKIKKILRARIGEEVYESWFNTCSAERYADNILTLSVPQKFLRSWIQSHYIDDVVESARKEFSDIESVDVALREPHAPGKVASRPDVLPVPELSADVAQPAALPGLGRPVAELGPVGGIRTPTQAGGFEGSPLDSRYTFDAFVIGNANRMAHAAATQVAETLFSGTHDFNPLYIHSAVGLGKTHLLQAIAWQVRRRMPQAQVLYLTAERFRFQFVEALQSREALAFKDRFRSIDMLIIDDLEFLHGQHTEQEFDHIINALLDGGKQVVVASSRPPSQVDKLSERMRSRLQRGLVTEIAAPDYELRLKILERRVAEKRATDPSFQVPHDVLGLLAERLTENGREMEGAAIRLHAQWQYMRTPITRELAENVIRDLFHNSEPRRVRIEDIIKVVSRHFGISKPDILSQRRHRSVVWPRQIGMYLAKQLTARSLPEIGRRFGNRDHTTVLHAIRKIEGALDGNQRLRDEIDDLKKLLSN